MLEFPDVGNGEELAFIGEIWYKQIWDSPLGLSI